MVLGGRGEEINRFIFRAFSFTHFIITLVLGSFAYTLLLPFFSFFSSFIDVLLCAFEVGRRGSYFHSFLSLWYIARRKRTWLVGWVVRSLAGWYGRKRCCMLFFTWVRVSLSML